MTEVRGQGGSDGSAYPRGRTSIDHLSPVDHERLYKGAVDAA